MLIHRTQPKRGTCLATALAMICNVSVEQIFSVVGHDGSEEYWPELPTPHCQRGIVVNEMVYAAHRLGVTLMPVIPNWPARPTSTAEPKNVALPPSWVDRMFQTHSGIIIGETKSGAYHAVAWDHHRQLVLDPSGSVYPRQDFGLESFWAAV